MAVNINPITNRIIMLVLLCYPAMLLTVKSGMNGMFFLLLLTSAFCLFRAPKSAVTSLWDGYSVAFAIAMASPLLAVFLSQAYHGGITASAYDGPSRFLFAIPIFLALRQIEFRAIAVLQYGLPLGALSALLVAATTHRNWNSPLAFSNTIHFGDSALMLGFLSLLSINWGQRDRAPVLALKICGLMAGLYLSEQASARGSWAAIPVLVFIWFMSQNPAKIRYSLVVTTLSVLLVAVLSYSLVGAVQYQMDMIYFDLVDFQHGHKDTSIGIRFQLWQAALNIFVEHPLFGVGPNGFAQMMAPLSGNGMLTPQAAFYGRGDVHNEILAKAAELGIFGLLSTLSVFAVPLVIFFMRLMNSPTAQAKTAAFMGICLVAGFFIFGLTAEIFNLKMTAAFYSLTVAVLLAAATYKTTSPPLEQEALKHLA